MHDKVEIIWIIIINAMYTKGEMSCMVARFHQLCPIIAMQLAVSLSFWKILPWRRINCLAELVEVTSYLKFLFSSLSRMHFCIWNNSNLFIIQQLTHCKSFPSLQNNIWFYRLNSKLSIIIFNATLPIFCSTRTKSLLRHGHIICIVARLHTLYDHYSSIVLIL